MLAVVPLVKVALVVALIAFGIGYWLSGSSHPPAYGANGPGLVTDMPPPVAAPPNSETLAALDALERRLDAKDAMIQELAGQVREMSAELRAPQQQPASTPQGDAASLPSPTNPLDQATVPEDLNVPPSTTPDAPATVSPRAPAAQTHDRFEVRFVKCERNGSQILAHFTITNHAADRTLRLWCEHGNTRLHDDQGNEYRPAKVALGNVENSYGIDELVLIQGIRTKGRYVFEGVGDDVAYIARLAIHGDDWLATFRNLTIEHPEAEQD